MTPDFTSEAARWEAVKRRDPAADGRFFYSVRTTGVFCRPNCAARTPRRENVSFHLTCEEAERAGFRPCRRCRPGAESLRTRNAAAVERACRMIDEAETPPALAELADAAGFSPFHFHRVFKEITGVTPKQYAAARRSRRIQDELRESKTVTEAIYAAGYNASSRFYEASAGILGMTPGAWRDGGRGATIRFAVGESSLGPVLVAATGNGVCAIEFGDDPDALVRSLQDRFPKAELVGGDAGFEDLVAIVIGMVEEPGRAADLPLDYVGTAFQQRVWQALREIPAGETVSYAELAARIGMPQGARAVASACASNTLAVAVPCHRVVRADGGLSGYRWGVERKRTLLKREGRT